MKRRFKYLRSISRLTSSLTLVTSRVAPAAHSRRIRSAPGVLARADPPRIRIGLRAGRFAHLHDARLKESERDHVAAHAAHADPVADREGVPAQQHQIGMVG
jgi:hypothetical protein